MLFLACLMARDDRGDAGVGLHDELHTPQQSSKLMAIQLQLSRGFAR